MLLSVSRHRLPRHLSAIACAAALALASTPFTSHAADQVSAAVPLDIPAGPLSTTLTRIGQTSRTTIVAAPALLEGLQAPSIKGKLTPVQAVRQAIAGSDLKVDETPSGALHLRRQTGGEIEPPQADREDARNNATPSTSQPPSPQTAATLQPIVVSDRRIGGSLMQPTRQVTVIEEQELEDLRAISPNLGVLLSKSVPGLSDSSRNLTDFGQTLRGRNVLVLVDGIPLNTNRDSARNLVNIEPSRIERIEIARGSNAIYGSGATGGIVSVTTKPVGGEPMAQTTVGMDASLSHLSREGAGAQVQQYFSGRKDRIDYEVDLSARRVGGSYDGHGDRIAPDASQGDLFDSNSFSLGGKLGLRIDANQRVQLAASYLRTRQDTDYASDPSVATAPLGSVTARAIKGLVLDQQNQVENALLSASYEHKDLAGSALSALLYLRDNSTRFAPSDSRNNVNRGNNVDQVLQNNKVFGGRLTIDTPFGAERDTRLIWGADFIQERSNMPLDVFDPAVYDASGGLVFRTIGQQTYLPWTTTRSVGTFGQLQHKFDEHWSAEGGLRYEAAEAGFNDFQPLSQSRLANPATVRGGKVRYDAWLYNAGLSFKPVSAHEFYASFSQGFDLPDVGLQLRNAGAGFNIDSSELEPVKTDNYELGWRGRFGSTLGTLAAFHSRSDLGAIQSFNNGLRLLRTRERIRGLEASLDHYGDAWSAGGSVTWMQGRETPQGAQQDQIMTGYRIPPLKLTGYLQYKHGERWSVRTQFTWFGSRDYRLADGRTQFARADVTSYYTVDVVGRYHFDRQNTVSVGVQNLLNRYYLPLYSQLLRSGSNNSRLPAAGAVLTVSYSHRW